MAKIMMAGACFLLAARVTADGSRPAGTEETHLNRGFSRPGAEGAPF